MGFLVLIAAPAAEAVQTGDGVPSTSSQAKNHSAPFKRVFTQCTGIAMDCILQLLKLFSVPHFSSCMPSSAERR